MNLLATKTLSVAALAAALSAQGTMQGYITPSVSAPQFGTTTFVADQLGNFIQNIQQIEMRHLGSGTYRVMATAKLTTTTDTKLITGLLNMAVNPAVWTPQGDVEPLNVSNTATDEFQGSMSSDGLTVVWDNYASVSYPNATGTTFVCARPNLSAPFDVNNVRAIAGVATGGVDPHIAQELAGGHVLLTFIDFNTNSISKGDLDPATGSLTNISIAVAGSGRTGFQFCHSSHAQRNGLNQPAALSYSEYINTAGAPSDAMWTQDLNNTGAPVILIPGTSAGIASWYANPAVVGGTWVHATARSSYLDPTLTEATCLANTDLRSGSGRITAFAPIRPAGNGSFISVVAIGTPAPAYNIPPVVGNILLFPTVGVLDIRFNNVNTGVAEWVFTNVHPINLTFTTQVVTLDTLGNAIYAGNAAQLFM